MASSTQIGEWRCRAYATVAIRIAITSDLHVDHHADAIGLVAEAVRRAEPDVLVVAGDLTADDALLERSLATLRPSAREAVFVPGNHDLWVRKEGPTSRDRYERIVPARARAAGFRTPFDGSPTELFGHRFVSVTGWYDYSLRNRAMDGTFTQAAYDSGSFGVLQWADKLRIRWPGVDGVLLDDPDICTQHVASLGRQLARPGELPIVVVTHHLPFAELCTVRQSVPWDFLNGFMGSQRLGALIAADPRVRLTVSGHTHFGKDVTIARAAGEPIRAIVSPLGYPREYEHMGLTLAERVAQRVTIVEL